MSDNGELTSKVCSKCLAERPIEQFNKDKRYSDGYFGWCRPCMKEYRDKRKQDPEKAAHDRERTMDWYWENREEKKAKNNARSRERWENDPEYRERKNRQKMEAHRRKYNTDPEYTEKHKKSHVLARGKRRALIAGGGGSHTEAQWVALCHKYGNKCLCCGKEGELTRDHVIPIAKGGSDTIDNLQPLCIKCNKKKHTKTLDYRPDGGTGLVINPVPRQLKLEL